MMLKVVRAHAAGLIFTTAAARDSILRELDPTHMPAMLTVPLPLAAAFEAHEPEIPALRAERYFIVCSAIDPRKNHLMLLEIWRELVRRHGEAAPRLVVIGSAAWAGNDILHALVHCGEMRRHVIVATGLSSPALRRLMAHATALLLPSRAEGYGLPVIEALTLGTPVVLSDLPALREVAGARAIYLDPDDQAGWIAAIEALHADCSAARAAIAGYRVIRAPEYFAEVQLFLRTLGEE